MEIRMIVSLRQLGVWTVLLALSSVHPPAGGASELSEAAPRLLGAAARSPEAYDRLGELCDNYGHRLSGSAQLEAAIDWTAKLMREYGFENVRKEEVLVPHWVRGEEGAYLTSPAKQRLHILGLGRSVGTPDGGIEAPMVVVESFDDLEARDEKDIRGRIVLFNVPYDGYGRTVRYRGSGPSAAARKGAVACFVRSVGLPGMQTPHTGALRYSEEDPKIPAAAVSREDALMIARMIERGDEVIAHLEMQAHTLEDAVSHNVMGEIPGSVHPEEIVVLGGHIDSWDVGQGAQDDGVGCMIALHAVRLIQRLGLQPKRTLRVVLWTNEENGLRGGAAYAEAHADEIERHVAAIEADSGNGRARGFRLDLREAVVGENSDADSLDLLREEGLQFLDTVGAQLRSVGADTMRAGGSGADISPLARQGVPCLGLDHDASEYFRIHHTESDTFDRIIPEDLNHNVAVMAIMAFALTQMEGELRGLRSRHAP
jgi:Peptidase family M28